MASLRHTRAVTREEVRQTVADVAEAGRRLCRAQRSVAWSLKPDGSFITALDRRTEDWLRTRLEKRFPGRTFIGEESAGPAPAAPVRGASIILDPIDGTAAFARGLGFFAISLALFDDAGRPDLAVLHLPAMGRFYVASFEAGRGRLHGVHVGPGRRITLRRVFVPSLPTFAVKDAYVYLGSDPHLQLDLSRWPGKTRALGATAAHLGMLLDETIDPVAVIVTRYKIWDVAAGLALAEAAGLEIRDLRDPRSVSSVRDLLGRDPGLYLPPLLVGRRKIVAMLLSRVALIPPRPRSADIPFQSSPRKRPSRR
jgi:fructose-1,6-bisphosphatase/inositol monophosphatase family enzyme